MPNLVMLITDDDSLEVENPVWHLASSMWDAPRVLCTGEVYGEGEGEALFKVKFIKKGGITCQRCVEMITIFKSISL